MSSVIRCRDYELIRTQSLFGVRERRARSGSIAKARNEITKVFLAGRSEYLWFVDADMGFPKDALQKMLAVADPIERPIIGGLCFAHRTEGYDDETYAEYFGHIPTLSMWNKNENGEVETFSTVSEYPKDTLVRVDSTGAAMILIHRNVLERVLAEFGEHWFTQLPHPTRPEPFGEDTSFFIRCDKLGIPLHVHTGVRTSHDKGGIMLTEATFEQQQILREALISQGAEVTPQ